MRRTITAILSIGAAAAIAIGCGSSDSSSSDSSATSTSANTPALPLGAARVDLDPASFRPNITNRYWPMQPGRRWVYRETDEEGKTNRVVVTATSKTKRIANGITARVVRDSVTRDGRVIEDTFDWYAQDAAGTIWYLGEDTAEFEHGKVKTRSGSFEAGVDGAQAGVIMPAEPRDGMRYRQEYYKGEAEDNGEVLSTAEQAEVPAGHYSRALLTKDTSAIEPRVLEYKLYAPGVGPVLTLGVSGGGGREELVGRRTVDARAANAAGTAPLGTTYP